MQQKSIKLNLLENLEIYKRKKQNNQKLLNKQLENNSGILFRTLNNSAEDAERQNWSK